MNPCGEIHNWRVSEDPTGGTPGRVNSVFQENPDRKGPGIDKVVATAKDTLKVLFSERLHPGLSADPIIEIDNGMEYTNYHYNPLQYNILDIALSTILEPGRDYRITINGVKDCVKNPIVHEGNYFIFQLPDYPDSGDLFINEIMFNPKPLGVDWVEIINISDKFLFLNGIGIGTVEDHGNRTHRVQSGFSVIRPGDYAVLTLNSERVIADFPVSEAEKIIELQGFPILPDQAGDLFLTNRDNILLDYMEYQSSFHHPLT